MLETEAMREPHPSVASSEMLLRNLSMGLHSAAQPLAVLRASLSLHDIDRLTKKELRDLAAHMATEVDRACVCFGYLQQLVHIESTRSLLLAVPILRIIQEAAGGVDLLFLRDEMHLKLTMPGGCEPQTISAERTLQAFSIVFLVAHGISHKHDSVEAIGIASHGLFRVVVSNTSSTTGHLSGQYNLAMAVAEAIMRSQNGSLTWSCNPFRVQFDFTTALLQTNPPAATPAGYRKD